MVRQFLRAVNPSPSISLNAATFSLPPPLIPRGISLRPLYTSTTRKVINALFAGYHTTGVSLTRVLQLLGSPDSKGLVKQLIQELNSNVDTRSEKDDGEASASAMRPVKGIFRAFPLLDVVVLETFR